MIGVQIGVARSGSVWSVMHNGGFLGHVATRSEALSIAQMLADWAAARGRPTEVRIEDGAQIDEQPEVRGRLIDGQSAGTAITPVIQSSSPTEDDMQIQEIMTHGAEVVDPNTMVRDIARRMRQDNLGAYPVGENDRLVGMVTDRDIVVRGVADDRPPGNTSVREVMSEKIIYCFENDDVNDVAQSMAEHQVRRIPVLNRDKRLVGMVALADLGLGEVDAAKTALRGVSQPTDVPRQM